MNKCLGMCLSQCQCNCEDCTICGLQSDYCECTCECSDICECERYKMREECTCGHREHGGYCKSDRPCLFNCELKLCPNDIHHNPKGSLFPEWFFNCHGGNCMSCAIAYGHRFVNTDIVEECVVCYEVKQMTKLRCDHLICWNCWASTCKTVSNDIASCPLCRKRGW